MASIFLTSQPRPSSCHEVSRTVSPHMSVSLGRGHVLVPKERGYGLVPGPRWASSTQRRAARSYWKGRGCGLSKIAFAEYSGLPDLDSRLTPVFARQRGTPWDASGAEEVSTKRSTTCFDAARTTLTVPLLTFLAFFRELLCRSYARQDHLLPVNWSRAPTPFTVPAFPAGSRCKPGARRRRRPWCAGGRRASPSFLRGFAMLPGPLETSH